MLVVFEGIDGSGKTTVSNRVASALRQRDLTVSHVRAGGKLESQVAEDIREFGRDARHLELGPRAELLLYLARDVQMMEGPLSDALAKSEIVLADRFRYTAEALARFGRHVPEAITRRILDAVLGETEPDLVVLVDVDPVLARARKKSAKLMSAEKRPPSRKGLSGVGLQYRLRRGYLELAAADPARWVVLANEDSLEKTVDRVVDLIVDARRAGLPSALARFRAGDRPPPAPVPVHGPEQALERFLQWVDERSVREPAVAAYFLRGLSGEEIGRRRVTLSVRVPDHVLVSLTGLADETSFRIREELAEKWPRAAARSLAGLDGQGRDRALRLALEAVAPADVAATLALREDEEAWDLRLRLQARVPEAVIASLAGLRSDRAWSLREQWLDSKKSELRVNPEIGRVAARSVSGLDDDRAWKIRDAVREIAPVAAISSLARLDSEMSFQWRRAYVSRAPKTVMMSLRGVSTAPAWDLRRSVAADCKEAVDSIQDLDDEEAWELRDACAGVWPSTVVKSLGSLSSTPRGRLLLERQLNAYPGHLSLLKHAAAVALGGYRDVPSFDP